MKRYRILADSELNAGVLLSGHRWFKTTKTKLDERRRKLDAETRPIFKTGYFEYRPEIFMWNIDEDVFPDVSEVIEIEDSDDIFVTTTSVDSALRYKLMLG